MQSGAGVHSGWPFLSWECGKFKGVFPARARRGFWALCQMSRAASCRLKAGGYNLGMPSSDSQFRKNHQETPPPMTRGTVFVYLAIPVQIALGAELTARTAHVRDLPYEEAVADPEKARGLRDAIRAQDTPAGTRLKLLGTVPGGADAKDEIFRAIQDGIVAESDALQRLASEPVAGNA